MNKILLLSFVIIITEVFSILKVKPATSQPSVCDDAKIDDFLWVNDDGDFFVFNNIYFWEYNFDNNTLENKREIRKVWPQVRTPITAVTDYKDSAGTEYIIFFGNDTYWKYTLTTDSSDSKKSTQISIDRDDSRNRSYKSTQRTTTRRERERESENEYELGYDREYERDKRDYNQDDSNEVTFEFELQGKYVAPSLKTIEAIQIMNNDEEQNAYVCDNEHVLLCSLSMDKTIVIQRCAAIVPFNTYIDGEHFTAFAKYNSRSFLAAGTRVYSRFNETQLIKKRVIKTDLYKCRAPTSFLKKYWKYGAIALAVILVAYLILIAVSCIRRQREAAEDQSIDETTADDPTRAASKVSIAIKSNSKKNLKGKSKISNKVKGKKNG